MSDRPLTEDFYVCPTTGDLVYKWQDERMVLVATEALRELRAEVERLTAANAELGQMYDDLAALYARRLPAERALADQLAEALRYLKPGNRSFGDRMADAALAAWEAARHE